MTTPANRAPKVSLFGAPVVFEDDTGSWVPGYVAGHPSTGRILVRSYDGREDRVLLVSDDDVTWRRADGTIPFEPTTPADDPLGPALPAKVADEKSFGRLAWAAYLEQLQRNPLTTADAWDAAAAAVIAAHEAGKETERVVRYAIQDSNGWWFTGTTASPDVSRRATFASPEIARGVLEVSGCHSEYQKHTKIVRITTRRRRVVK